MTTEPYASADRVFWIVDNGSSHRGAASVKRMTKAWPNAHLIHLPVHASWLDQAEIYFSVVQRKVVNPNDFTDLGPDPRPPRRVRDPLQRHRQTIQLEVHPHRPRATCCTASTPTTRPSPTPWQPDLYPRRTYGRDH